MSIDDVQASSCDGKFESPSIPIILLHRAGVPQGAIISPLLSNLYLNDLDHLMADAGYEMTGYADDLVIQCSSREEAERALARVAAWTAERGLTLHPVKTKNVHVDEEGFEILGYRFIKHRHFLRKKSLAKVGDTDWIIRDIVIRSSRSMGCLA